MRCDSADDVISRSRQFLDCMRRVVHPSELSFSSYTAAPPITELCASARTHASALSADDALASLTIVAGAHNSFVVTAGTHAKGTICSATHNTARLYLLVVAAVIALASFLWLRHATRP